MPKEAPIHDYSPLTGDELARAVDEVKSQQPPVELTERAVDYLLDGLATLKAEARDGVIDPGWGPEAPKLWEEWSGSGGDGPRLSTTTLTSCATACA